MDLCCSSASHHSHKKNLHVAEIGGHRIASNNGTNYVLRLPHSILEQLSKYHAVFNSLADLVHISHSNISFGEKEYFLQNGVLVDNRCMDARASLLDRDVIPTMRLPAASLLMGIPITIKKQLVAHNSKLRDLLQFIEDSHVALSHNNNGLRNIRLHTHIAMNGCGGATYLNTILENANNISELEKYKKYSELDKLMWQIHYMLENLDNLDLVNEKTAVGIEFPHNGQHTKGPIDFNVNASQFEIDLRNWLRMMAYDNPQRLFHAKKSLCSDGTGEGYTLHHFVPKKKT